MAENNDAVGSMPPIADYESADDLRQFGKFDRAIQILKGFETLLKFIVAFAAFGFSVFLFYMVFTQIGRLNQHLAATDLTVERMNGTIEKLNGTIKKMNGTVQHQNATIQHLAQINAFSANKSDNFWAAGGGQLVIRADGLTVYAGCSASARAIAAKQNYLLESASLELVAAYFEMTILNTASSPSMSMGFCDKQFPAAGSILGYGDGSFNSMGLAVYNTYWIGARINGYYYDFDGPAARSKWFGAGDVVGTGLLYSLAAPFAPLKYFATLNGNLLGTINLPPQLANISFYPAYSSSSGSNAVRANFGTQMWRYEGNLTQML